MSRKNFRPNLLCIAPPPVSPEAPPAGAAYLLGYLKHHGCYDFDLLDLRLWVPDSYAPTWSYTGAFAESFVLDIPDLPLVLQLLEAVDEQAPLDFERTPLLERFCLERGIPPKYLHGYLCSLNRLFERAFEQIPRIDFIGFTVWTTNYLATLLAAAHLKRRKSPPFIIAGGPQVTASKASGELALRSGLFDLVALGEGEEILARAYEAYSLNGRVPEALPGTLYVDSGGSFRRTEQPLLSIDSLPVPSFEEMHLEAYQRDAAYRTLPIQFSRGCTDKCSFCSEWRFWRRFRPDTVEHTVEQLKELQRNYDGDFFIFMDSLLNGSPKRLVALAEAILRESIDIRWASFMRAQMDSETAKLLARSGCNDVFVGIESFSDETLELMRKRRTKADNIKALEAFLDAGIGVTAGFVPGFPGDTRSAFIESANVLRKLHERYSGQLIIQEEPFVVQPNSPIYDNLAEMGLAPTSWDAEYLDIAPRYRDITSDIFCAVEGNGQGLERMGRLSIVQAIAADDRSDKGFSFMPAHGEKLSLSTFDFEHIYGGWYLARKKSDAGHVYGLLVNAKEMEELELLQEEYSLEGLSSRRVVSALARLERAHVIPPSRRRPNMVRGVYKKKGDAGCSYSLSPFVVARTMGWANGNKVLIANVTTDRWLRRPARDGEVIAMVAKRPFREEQLWKAMVSGGLSHTRRQLQETVHDLKEEGVLTICDFRQQEHAFRKAKRAFDRSGALEISATPSAITPVSLVPPRSETHTAESDAGSAH